MACVRSCSTDPEELVSKAAYRTVSREFVRAVAAAQVTLRAAGREDEATRLDGVTWHALRHTFASRLVAAGVDLRTVQELGGWRTLSIGAAVRAPLSGPLGSSRREDRRGSLCGRLGARKHQRTSAKLRLCRRRHWRRRSETLGKYVIELRGGVAEPG